MVQKTITVVKIGGREYTIRSVESQEYIHKVAIYVNNKIEERLKRGGLILSTSMVVMLAAINLADEVIKLQDKVEKLQRELVRCIRFWMRMMMFPYHQMFMMYPEELNDNFLFKFTYNPSKRPSGCFLFFAGNINKSR